MILSLLIAVLLFPPTASFDIIKPMVDTTWVDDRHGLSLNEGPWSYRDNENGVLFYLEYILIKEARGDDVKEDVEMFRSIVEKIRSYDVQGNRITGLYDRGADESLNPVKEDMRVISHDNLTAIAAFSYRYGDGSEADHIARHGLKNQLRYDNRHPESPSWLTIQWPTDWAFWALSSKKWYYMPLVAPLYPFFLLRCWLSSYSERAETSEIGRAHV